MSTDLERNKENVKAFYDLMFNQCRPRRRWSDTPANEYRQHNTHVADGKEASSSTSSGWPATTPARAWSSCAPSPRGTTSSCTATSGGRVG